jgi:hypothetical protein
MQTIRDYIHTVRQKPRHVRQRMAMLTSAGITGLVAVIWGGTLISNGSFSFTIADQATSTSEAAAVSPVDFALSGTGVNSNFSQLMGAVSAATGVTTSEPTLRIIDGTTTSSIETQAATSTNETVIPF